MGLRAWQKGLINKNYSGAAWRPYIASVRFPWAITPLLIGGISFEGTFPIYWRRVNTQRDPAGNQQRLGGASAGSPSLQRQNAIRRFTSLSAECRLTRHNQGVVLLGMSIKTFGLLAEKSHTRTLIQAANKVGIALLVVIRCRRHAGDVLGRRMRMR